MRPPSERWEQLAEMMRIVVPDLETKLEYCRAHPPDPIKNPVTSAIVTEYASRLERTIARYREGAKGLKDEFLNEPNATTELQEIESWIMRLKPGAVPRELTLKDRDAMGNWFVSKMGMSYSQARRVVEGLSGLHISKGAPSKRTETLRLLDARFANKWSYPELAKRMCDCGATVHTQHCSERIRKRLKEAECLLLKYHIRMPSTYPGEK
jgi:hypothetical protein